MGTKPGVRSLCHDALVNRGTGRIATVTALAIGLPAAALLILAAAGALRTAPARADDATLSVQITDTPTSGAMPPGFLGVSIEYRGLHVYTGRDPRAVNPVLIQLLRNLAPGQAPVLRIGGDSTDATWWPMRGVIPPGGINYGLTKGWMRTTQALAASLSAHLILGINMAAGRPALAAAEARALLQGIGRRYISAFELGNEPDIYNIFAWYRDRRGRVVYSRPRSYRLSGLIRDFSHLRAALPKVPLAGPAFSSLAWAPGLSTFIASEQRLSTVTLHRYPLRGCTALPTATGYPSIPNLLADSSSAGLAAAIAPSVAVAHQHGLPFRLDELNSASCSGRKGVSDTFAAALWMLDTLFNLAAQGVNGVNIHTLPGAAYEPFTFSQHGRTWQAFVHPSYYGALMFAQAFPPGARLLGTSAPSGPVKVWATQSGSQTRVVLINKDPSTPVQVQLQLPGNATPAVAQSLLAPSLAATSGVTYGGQTFDPLTTTGQLGGAPITAPIAPVLGTYTVELPAASALLLTR